ncbi:nuclear transport factor 2 family protein [Mycobacterium intracellulare]|uniref:nuclear transport factor 2 family protein n=1 Tax=Mycobacterium intracellulare TaxID=1767 RepID=UPI001E4BBDA2|nr:nuclear transport factor 2 family protein [Mycobacterium intracellulare]UGT99192.1 nuclear transport factor 2 family protein [Mycobacterium intracellulare]
MPQLPFDELNELLEREKIRDCIARVARGEDRRIGELIRGSYWPEAMIDHGIFAGTFDDYLAWVVPGSPAIRLTQHVLGQSVIDLRADTALVETHVTAYHRVATDGEDSDTVIGGRYLDWMEKRGGEWRIAQRTMLYDWYRDMGRSVDWSQGLMGMPFSGDHYYGRALDDHSEAGLRRPLAPSTDS